MMRSRRQDAEHWRNTPPIQKKKKDDNKTQMEASKSVDARSMSVSLAVCHPALTGIDFARGLPALNECSVEQSRREREKER